MMYDNLSNLELIKILKSLESHTEDVVRKRVEVFIRNERKLQSVLWEIIQLLVSIVERKDPYASYHHQEMCILACYIAEGLGMSKEQVDGVCMAGMLHDIGKINLPDELFRKVGVLSEDEQKLMNTHPQLGFEILKKIDFPGPVATIVLQHHEKMDGSGYPSGLSGDEIVPEARILCVTDAVEAMTSPRSYRTAFSISDALKEISGKSGVLYDSSVVEVCKKLFFDN